MCTLSETLRRCEAMIERHAPRALRCGGIGCSGIGHGLEYRRYTEAEKAALVATVMAQPERRVADVAEEFGVPLSTAERWVRAIGGKGQRASGATVFKAGTVERIARAMELRATGLTVRAIASKMGLWPGSVSYLLKKGAAGKL